MGFKTQFIHLISIYILLLNIISCSTNSKSSYNSVLRNPASLKQNCISLLNNYLLENSKNKKISIDDIIKKIEGGKSLTFREKLSTSFIFARNILNKQYRDIFKKLLTNKILTSNDILFFKTRIKPKLNYYQFILDSPTESRFVGGDRSQLITFGLEVELILKENPGLLNHYKLDSFSDEDWLELPIEQRLDLAQSQLISQDAYSNILTKLSFSHPTLPNTLFSEPHKTLEANDMIFQSLEEMKRFLRFFHEEFGRGSFQGHLVYKNKSKVEGVTGYINFESDLAQLLNFERGYSRYLKEGKTPSQNLIHHSLGPLGEDERTKFYFYENQLLEEEVNEEAIGKAKTIYGPNFRIGRPYDEGYVGFEHRQYHKNYEELLRALDLQSKELEISGGLSKFKQFEDETQISEGLLKQAVQQSEIMNDVDLERLEIFYLSVGDYLNKLNEQFGLKMGGAQAHLRFYFPLKNWKNHPLINSLTSEKQNTLKRKISLATRSYLLEISKLALDDNMLITDDIIKQLQILNAKWGYDVGLSKLFLNFRHSKPKQSKRIKYHESTWFFGIKPVNLNEDSYTIPIYNIKEIKNSDFFNSFRLDTIEIIYSKNASRYGHISLRVGTKEYELTGVEGAKVRDSTLSSMSGKKGYIFKSNNSSINEIQSRLNNLYSESKLFNIPPFDKFGGLLKLNINENGIIKYVSNSKGVGSNHRVAKGRVVNVNGSNYLRSPGGYMSPIIEKDGILYVQSLTCASSVLHALKEYLGLDLGNYLGAHSLAAALENGNTKVHADFQIHY